MNETEHTVATESGKLIHRKHISGPIVFQTEKNGHRKSEKKLHQRIDTDSEALMGNTFSGTKYLATY